MLLRLLRALPILALLCGCGDGSGSSDSSSGKNASGDQTASGSEDGGTSSSSSSSSNSNDSQSSSDSGSGNDSSGNTNSTSDTGTLVGSATGPGDAGSATSGGECIALDADCMDHPGDCCTDLLCVQFQEPSHGECRKLCKTHDDCDSGCCVPLPNADRSVCLEERYCPSHSCAAVDEECGSSTACCDGLNCAGTLDGLHCRPSCEKNADCDTDCCAQLGDSDLWACLDPIYCPEGG